MLAIIKTHPHTSLMMMLAILSAAVMHLTAGEALETQIVTDLIPGYSVFTPPACPRYFNIPSIEQENQYVNYDGTLGEADTVLWTFMFYND